MNTEQLTQVVNELRDSNEALRQELARRGLEHQAQHSGMESMQRRIDELESQISSGSGRGGGNGAIASEIAKRLDRWATSTDGLVYQGVNGKVGLMQWVQEMKERA